MGSGVVSCRGTLQTQAWLVGGAYELEFTVEQASAVPGAKGVTDAEHAPPAQYAARTGFVVSPVDPEYLEPTANLALLNEAASRTGEVGRRVFPGGSVG